MTPKIFTASEPIVSFKSLEIKAQGRTTILKLNYRSTAQALILAYEFAKEIIMLPTLNSDEDMPPLLAPDSAGREGLLPELVKCANYKAEIAYIAQRAKALQASSIPWYEIASSTGLNGWGSEHSLNHRGWVSQWLCSTRTAAVATLTRCALVSS